MKRILVAFLMLAAFAAPLLTVPGTASAQDYVSISVGYAPPPLPWYPQPSCPSAGYIWTPGYWAWGPYGYYWVPGTWVFAPAVGLFWTPGYWAWDGGYYWWHAGYWGPTVGFYGGIDYGYGYTGYGYIGGYWNSGRFYYNRTVTNVDVTYIHNTYNQPVRSPRPDRSRVSYNGGESGVRVQATAAQLAYAHEQHVSLTAMQLHHQQLALDNPAQRFTVNQGRPQIVATTRPGEFQGSGVVRMDREPGGYVHDGARVVPPTYPNGVRVDREPQVRPGNPYGNEIRPIYRTGGNNSAVPMPRPNPRPTPPPAARTRVPHAEPPMSGFSNPYASAYQSPARTAPDNWNMNRSQMPRLEQLPRAPIRQASWSAPHMQMRMPSHNSGRSNHGNHGHPGG